MNQSSHTHASDCSGLLFETWLQIGLQRLYDRTLEEPVPDDLLRLIPPGRMSGSRQP